MPGGCDLCACVQAAGRDMAPPRKISGETQGMWHSVRRDKKQVKTDECVESQNTRKERLLARKRLFIKKKKPDYLWTLADM